MKMILGVCMSYDEVQRYKLAVVTSENIQSILSPKNKDATCFTQFVVDNVHRNLVAVCGKGYFTVTQIINRNLRISLY